VIRAPAAADAAAAVVSFRSIASPEPAAITATAVGFVALDRWALRSTYSDRENEVRT